MIVPSNVGAATKYVRIQCDGLGSVENKSRFWAKVYYVWFVHEMTHCDSGCQNTKLVALKAKAAKKYLK
jgi:hypothetical protein